MKKMKRSQTIGARFTAFQTAMRVLAGWRNCKCKLVGLEEAMTLATTAMQRALPLFSELEIANRSGLARTQIDLAYYAIVIVAVLVTKETGWSSNVPNSSAHGGMRRSRCSTRSLRISIKPSVCGIARS